MSIPVEFQHASEGFDAFLQDAQEISGLSTRNQTHTMAQAVLLAFRRRLSVADTRHFANVLRPVLRALFITDRDIEEPSEEFIDRAELTREVQDLRHDHDFSPDTAIQTAIQDVATALRRRVDESALDRLLGQMPDGAAEFWAVP